MSQNFKFHLIISLVLTLAIFKPALSVPLANEENELEEDSIDLSMISKRIFGEPDVITGEAITKYKFDGDTESNPEELGSYFEGDILIPTDDKFERSGIIGKSYRWRNGIIPYTIDGKFTKNELSVIQNAFDEYHNNTCIRFQKRTKERNYISITNKKTGCWSAVGCIGGRQEVNLQAPHCLKKNGTSIHELMHVVGFFHEHNHYIRDKYIRIFRKNIKPPMVYAFDKYSPKKIYGYDLPYDYASVMHYSRTSFSRNGKFTIIPLKNTEESRWMGQRFGFSDTDIVKINIMYKCEMNNTRIKQA